MTAAGLVNLAHLAFRRGEIESTIALGVEAIDVTRRVSGPIEAAMVENLVAWVAVTSGGDADAFGYADLAITRLREVPEHRIALPGVLHTAGEAARVSGRLDVAAMRHLEALDILVELDVQDTTFPALAGMAAIAVDSGRPELAATLLGAAGEGLVGSEEAPTAQAFLRAIVDAVRTAAGERYEELVAQGARLTLTEARDLAASLR